MFISSFGKLSRWENFIFFIFRLVVASTISFSQILIMNFLQQESEITEMRQTIELLRKQSIQAGLTSAHMQSMGVQVNGAKNGSSPTKATSNGQQHEQSNQNGNMQRHHSTDSVCSINSNGSNGSSQDKKKKKGWVSSLTCKQL